MHTQYQNFDIVYDDDDDKEKMSCKFPKEIYDTRRIDILQDNNKFFLRQIIQNNGLTLNIFAREGHSKT